MDDVPSFPDFVTLELHHRRAIESFVGEFPPYSDFNFVSLWSWNTDGSTQVANLNGNLVVSLPDYETGEPVYSLLGCNEIPVTLAALLDHLAAIGREPTLRLVPACVVDEIDGSDDFEIEEDVDNFDYILSTVDLAELRGKKFDRYRQSRNRIERRLGASTTICSLDLTIDTNRREVLRVFLLWEHAQSKVSTDTAAERIAIERVLMGASSLGVEALGVAIDGSLSAFAILEIARRECGFRHFAKADTRLRDLDRFLTWHTARWFHERGIGRINDEQDLGHAGLREAKLARRPAEFLHKYVVRAKKQTQ